MLRLRLTDSSFCQGSWPCVGDQAYLELRGFDVGGCQNYGTFLGPPNPRCRIILRTKKRTIILTTNHVIAFTVVDVHSERRAPEIFSSSRRR